MSFEKPNPEQMPTQEEMPQPEELQKSPGEDMKSKYAKMLKMASEFNNPENKEKDEKDPKIIDTVAALWTLEVATSQSCEGHLEHGRPYPWVMIEASNEPKQRFNDESNLKTEIAKRYNMPLDEINWRGDSKPAQELRNLGAANETEEYKKWRGENKKLYDKMAGWLNDFYKTREASADVKLRLDGPGDSAFEIRAGEESSDDQQNLEELISKRQEEMNAFTQFLKEKYIG